MRSCGICCARRHTRSSPRLGTAVRGDRAHRAGSRHGRRSSCHGYGQTTERLWNPGRATQPLRHALPRYESLGAVHRTALQPAAQLVAIPLITAEQSLTLLRDGLVSTHRYCEGVRRWGGVAESQWEVADASTPLRHSLRRVGNSSAAGIESVSLAEVCNQVAGQRWRARWARSAAASWLVPQVTASSETRAVLACRYGAFSSAPGVLVR